MKRHPSFALPLSLLLSLSGLAPAAGRVSQQGPAQQTPAAAPRQQPPRPAPSPSSQDDDVVRITTNLVQFDAVVTDKSGRHVTDLGAEEFEILIDGKRQEITHFSYVSNEAGAGVPTPAPKKNPDKNAPPAPPLPPAPPSRARTTSARRSRSSSISRCSRTTS